MFGFGEKSYKSGNEGEILENTQRVLVAARDASRSWTGRIMTLSSAIIAFSVSVASLPSFQASFDINKLRAAWMLLLAALVAGAFNLLLESRIAYAATLVQKNLKIRGASSVSTLDRIIAFILLIVILFWPVYTPKNKALAKPHLLVENWLYSLFGLIFVLETATFALFILGLLKFLSAFKI